MEGESSEFQDWEVLSHGSVSALAHSDSEEEASMEGDPEGMIRSDYFSIDSHERYAKTVSGVDLSKEGSVESENPSWVDPDSENRHGRKISGDLWSDSSSDRSVERRFSGSDTKHELGSVGIVEMKSGVCVDGVEEELSGRDVNSGSLDSVECKYRSLDAKSEMGLVENNRSDVGFTEIMNQGQDLRRLWSDSDDVMVSMKLGDVRPQSDYSKGEDGLGVSVEFEGGNSLNLEPREGDEHSEKDSGDGAIEVTKPDANPVNVGDKRRVIWWKVPLEFLKYCAFRVSPVLSFSVAAALLGLIILGWRLSRMKRRTQSLQLKVTVDEKKVSLFKSRAARLNEAFSVVRRVPITHPAAGLTTSWPVMNLR